MRFTILADTGKWRPSLIAALFAMLPLVILPLLADAGEVPRALLIAVAVFLAASLPSRVPGRTFWLAAGIALTVFALMLLSAAVNGWPSAVFGVHGRFQGLVSTLLLFASAAVGTLVFSGRLRTLATFVAVATAAEAIVVVGQVLVGLEPAGVIGNRVPAAAALAVGSVLALGSAAFSTGRTRVMFSTVVAIAVLALGVAGSRGAWLGFVVGVGIVGVALIGRVRHSVTIGVSLALAALVIAGASANAISASKLQLGALVTGSAASRWQIWRGTGEMIADAPLLGVGPGRFLYEFQRYEPVEHARSEGPDVRADQAHSLALQSAAESGAPAALAGVLLACLALWAAYRGMHRGDSASVIAGAALATYCVQGLLGVPSLGVDALGWLLGGVVIGRLDRSAERSTASAGAKPTRVALGVLGLVLVALVGRYAFADLMFARSTEWFAQGRFDAASAAAETAIELNPLVDVYRVGLADAVSYAGPAQYSFGLAQLDDGLKLEHASYDLLLARARLLKLSGAQPTEIADAYSTAVAAYPLGATVNEEGVTAFEAAGRRVQADRAREAVQAVRGGSGQAVQP